MTNSAKIAICIPSRGLVYSEMMESVDAARTIFHAQYPDVKTVLLMSHYRPMPDCRSYLVQAAIDAQATHILFVDDDMSLYPDAIIKLYEHDVDIVTGLCWNKTRGDRSKPMIGFLNPQIKIVQWTSEWYWPHFFEIDGCGLACCLIKVDVFKKLGGPADWFAWNWTQTITKDNGRTFRHTTPMGEDLFFCQQAREAGIKIWCDSGVIVRHMLFSHTWDNEQMAGYDGSTYGVEYFPYTEELDYYRKGNPGRMAVIDPVTPQEYWRPHFAAIRGLDD